MGARESRMKFNCWMQTFFELDRLDLRQYRLSTLRHADIIVYLSEGKKIAKGTFEKVRKAVPNFDRQAKLNGSIGKNLQ